VEKQESKIFTYEEEQILVDRGTTSYRVLIVYEPLDFSSKSRAKVALVVSDDPISPPYMQVKNAKQYVQEYIELREQGLLHRETLEQLQGEVKSITEGEAGNGR